jgi:phage tail sheath protein FI
MGVNTIQAVRSAARIGVAPRTLAVGSAGHTAWADLASRRLALFILNSVERGTRWIVHSKPHLDVADLAARQVREFFEQLHGAGAFGERLPAESFFVTCDDTRHAVTADSSEFHFVIGFAAVRDGEFHRFRISHSLSGSKVTACPYRSTLADHSPEELDWVDRLATRLRTAPSSAESDPS